MNHSNVVTILISNSLSERGGRCHGADRISRCCAMSHNTEHGVKTKTQTNQAFIHKMA